MTPDPQNLADREDTRDKLAAQAGVSHSTYDALRKVNQQGAPELVTRCVSEAAKGGKRKNVTDQDDPPHSIDSHPTRARG